MSVTTVVRIAGIIIGTERTGREGVRPREVVVQILMHRGRTRRRRRCKRHRAMCRTCCNDGFHRQVGLVGDSQRCWYSNTVDTRLRKRIERRRPSTSSSSSRTVIGTEGRGKCSGSSSTDEVLSRSKRGGRYADRWSDFRNSSRGEGVVSTILFFLEYVILLFPSRDCHLLYGVVS